MQDSKNTGGGKKPHNPPATEPSESLLAAQAHAATVGTLGQDLFGACDILDTKINNGKGSFLSIPGKTVLNVSVDGDSSDLIITIQRAGFVNSGWSPIAANGTTIAEEFLDPGNRINCPNPPFKQQVKLRSHYDPNKGTSSLQFIDAKYNATLSEPEASPTANASMIINSDAELKAEIENFTQTRLTALNTNKAHTRPQEWCVNQDSTKVKYTINGKPFGGLALDKDRESAESAKNYIANSFDRAISKTELPRETIHEIKIQQKAETKEKKDQESQDKKKLEETHQHKESLLQTLTSANNNRGMPAAQRFDAVKASLTFLGENGQLEFAWKTIKAIKPGMTDPSTITGTTVIQTMSELAKVSKSQLSSDDKTEITNLAEQVSQKSSTVNYLIALNENRLAGKMEQSQWDISAHIATFAENPSLGATWEVIKQNKAALNTHRHAYSPQSLMGRPTNTYRTIVQTMLGCATDKERDDEYTPSQAEQSTIDQIKAEAKACGVSTPSEEKVVKQNVGGTLPGQGQEQEQEPDQTPKPGP